MSVRLFLRLSILPILASVWCPAAPADAAPTVFPRTTFNPVNLGVLPAGGLVIAGHPNGGWLLVWPVQNDSLRLQATRMAPDGILGEPVTTPLLNEIELMVESLAVAPSGRWVAVWHVGDILGSNLAAGLFEPDGSLVRKLDLDVPIQGPSEIGPSGEVVAVPGGGFALLWGETTTVVGRWGADLFVARYSADGERIAGPVRLNELRMGNRRGGIAATATSLVVAWSHGPSADHPDVEPASFVQVLRNDLSPLTEPRPTDGSRLAAGPDGRFVLARSVHRGAPDFQHDVLVRPFLADATPAGPERIVATNAVREVKLQAEGTPGGVVWLTWIAGSLESSEIWARPFALDGTPLDAARSTGLAWTSAFDNLLAADPAGRMLAVVYDIGRPSFGVLFVGAAPPPEEVLTSPELPGFRVWVLITAPSGESRWGAAEASCLAETLCASGALPGRVEVLVRVVGPKPNGFLWPTLVKLSTSRVEVWIEQVATGELRHYVLPGASPGDDTLPGLFDRFGFAPQ